MALYTELHSRFCLPFDGQSTVITPG